MVLDHMPGESSATIILKHFQTDTTLGQGKSYTEAGGHSTALDSVQGILPVAMLLRSAQGLSCNGISVVKDHNKSMPGPSAVV